MTVKWGILHGCKNFEVAKLNILMAKPLKILEGAQNNLEKSCYATAVLYTIDVLFERNYAKNFILKNYLKNVYLTGIENLNILF